MSVSHRSLSSTRVLGAEARLPRRSDPGHQRSPPRSMHRRAPQAGGPSPDLCLPLSAMSSPGPQSGVEMAGRDFFLPQNIIDECGQTASPRDGPEAGPEGEPDGEPEERLSVDRHLLQRMLLSDEDTEWAGRPLPKAPEFFARVKAESGAEVDWPEQLKQDAKNKRDPWVRLRGSEEARDKAKALILELLQPRHLRVTLKLDVAFTDHSHIIGRSGRNSQRLMRETGASVHFPDANKAPGAEKSNQVTLGGTAEAAEEARKRLRRLAPLSLGLHLPDLLQGLDLPALLSHPSLAQAEKLSVSLRQDPFGPQPLILVRGSYRQLPLIRQTVAAVAELLGLGVAELVCSTVLDVLPPQQPFVLGPNAEHITALCQRCGVSVQLPSFPGDSAYLIRGQVDWVVRARETLIGLLPAILTFQTEAGLPGAEELGALGQRHGAKLSVRPCRSGAGASVWAEVAEANLAAAFDLRRELLGLQDEDEPKVIFTGYEFMKDLVRLFPALGSAALGGGPSQPTKAPRALELPPPLARFGSYEEARSAALAKLDSAPSGLRYPTTAFAGLGFSKTFASAQAFRLLPPQPPPLASRTSQLPAPSLAPPPDPEPSDSLAEALARAHLGQAKARSPRSFAETAHGWGGGGGGALASDTVEAALKKGTALGPLLASLGLGQYAPLFAAEEVNDVEALLALDDADLRNVGLQSHAARQRVARLQVLIARSLTTT